MIKNKLLRKKKKNQAFPNKNKFEARNIFHMFRLPFRFFLRKLNPIHFPHFSKPLTSYPFSTTNNQPPKPDPTQKDPSNINEKPADPEKKAQPDQKNPADPEKKVDEAKKAQNEQKINENPSEKPKNEEKRPSFREKLKLSTPRVSKCLEYGIHAWNLTFPKERYRDKFEQVKQKSREQKKQEEILFTEEELEKMQGNIPEWKRNALIAQEQKAARESFRQKMQSQLKSKINQTKYAKEMYQSESYKEYETFKKEMHQFKEDFKDHIENSPNPVIQTSLGIYVSFF